VVADEDGFGAAFPDARWVVLDSSGAERELVPGGAERRVTFAERGRFADAALAFRLHEFDAPLGAIRRGLGTVVPLRALSLFTPAQAEELVAGKPDIDVALLKRHTRYEGGYSAGHPVIRRFWRVLAALPPDDRAGYIRFCWGRSRLPGEGAPWSSQHTVNRLAGGSDASLPLAHTCFFSVDLPPYSSTERMAWGLRTAITWSLGGILNG
jgi:hypothetical protein